MAATPVLQVSRADIAAAAVVDIPLHDLGPGTARLRLDAFAVTANNITYAVYGDAMRYWEFFPAPDGPDWGVIPVWGFATVEDSSVDTLAVGQRLYGFLPMAGHVDLQPAGSPGGAVVDRSPRRSELAAVYNTYDRVPRRPEDDPDLDDVQMVLRPLFFTSFLIDDFLAVSDFFGAEQVVLTSASSKTALGTGHLLRRRGNVQVIGLTSPPNRAFAEGTGFYDRVLTYDQTDSLDERSSVLLDFAGNLAVVAGVHERLGTRLAYSSVIGGTHWDADRPPDRSMPGPERRLFFAPDHVANRAAEWGMAELQRRFDRAWSDFVPAARSALTVARTPGLEAAVPIYRDIVMGRADPAIAHVITEPWRRQ